MSSSISRQPFTGRPHPSVSLGGLPDNCRTVFVPRAIEQLSIEETATHLDIPTATVKTRFHRARGLMQQALAIHIEAAGLSAFDFAGARCDRMVSAVLSRVLASGPGLGPVN